MILSHLFGLSSHSFSLSMGPTPQITNPVKHPGSTSTFYSQDNLNCSTQKIQANVTPPPVLAILLRMLPLLPPNIEGEVFLFNQLLNVQFLIYSFQGSAGISSLCVASIPFSQPNPSPSTVMVHPNISSYLTSKFPCTKP